MTYGFEPVRGYMHTTCCCESVQGSGYRVYRGTSLIRTPPNVGPYSSPVPRDLW